MGIKGSATCVHDLRGRDRLAGRRAAQGHARDVHDDERGAPRRRHPGPRPSPKSAYQSAVAYARERLQGRSLAGAEAPGQAGRPDHRAPRRAAHAADACAPTPKAAARSAAGSRSQLDVRSASPTRRARQAADDLVALMTPIVKALLHRPRLRGGQSRRAGLRRPRLHPRIRHGAVRPRRAHRQIYEGTNGIQALDLVGRKLPAGRRPLAADASSIRSRRSSSSTGRSPRWPSSSSRSPRRFGACSSPPRRSPQAAMTRPGGGRRGGHRLSAPVRPGGARLHVGAHGAGRAGEGAAAAVTGMPRFYKAKLTTARFYMERMLPQAAASTRASSPGRMPMMELEEAAF